MRQTLQLGSWPDGNPTRSVNQSHSVFVSLSHNERWGAVSCLSETESGCWWQIQEPCLECAQRLQKCRNNKFKQAWWIINHCFILVIAKALLTSCLVRRYDNENTFGVYTTQSDMIQHTREGIQSLQNRFFVYFRTSLSFYILLLCKSVTAKFRLEGGRIPTGRGQIQVSQNQLTPNPDLY